jgi:hypothetical protein
MVEIHSLTGTARIATYVFPGAAKGEFTLDGGAALHSRLGDQLAVVAYRQEERFSGANCVIDNPLDNSIEHLLRHPPPGQAETSIAASRCAHARGRHRPGKPKRWLKLASDCADYAESRSRASHSLAC